MYDVTCRSILHSVQSHMSYMDIKVCLCSAMWLLWLERIVCVYVYVCVISRFHAHALQNPKRLYGQIRYFLCLPFLLILLYNEATLKALELVSGGLLYCAL